MPPIIQVRALKKTFRSYSPSGNIIRAEACEIYKHYKSELFIFFFYFKTGDLSYTYF